MLKYFSPFYYRILGLTENGVYEHWMDYAYYNITKYRPKDVDRNPYSYNVLYSDNLRGVYIMFIIGINASLVAFACEFLIRFAYTKQTLLNKFFNEFVNYISFRKYE